MIRRPPEHRAVDVGEMVGDIGPRVDAAVDHDLQLGEVRFQPVDIVVFERRDLAVLLRRQAFQDRVACVHDERPATCLRHGGDECRPQP